MPRNTALVSVFCLIALIIAAGCGGSSEEAANAEITSQIAGDWERYSVEYRFDEDGRVYRDNFLYFRYRLLNDTDIALNFSDEWNTGTYLVVNNLLVITDETGYQWRFFRSE